MPLSFGRCVSRALTSFSVLGMTRSGFLLSLECGEILEIPSLCLIYHRQFPSISLANILRDYTLEFKIRVERAFADLRECLREAVRDRDYCRGLAPLGIEAECGQLRSRVAGLKDELATLTCRVAALDHTWDEERATLEASGRADGSALELV